MPRLEALRAATNPSPHKATLLDFPLNEPGSNRGATFFKLSAVGDSRAASGTHFSSPSVDRTDRAGALNGRCQHRRWRVDSRSCGHRSIWRPSDVAGNDRHSDAGVLQPGHHALRALYRGIDFCGLLSHSPGTLVLDRFLSLHRRRAATGLIWQPTQRWLCPRHCSIGSPQPRTTLW